MLDNYPPGFDSSILDGNPRWDKIREGIEDDAEIKYSLTVTINDEEVFASDYFSETSMQEDLRKPERAIDEWLTQEADRAYDDATEERDEEDDDR